ncbi:MAG: hypothetical protein K8S94_08005 [Planctomycetia bacterium]|nr:hypothetical protein [Planctomycetia bacterium]
MPTPRSLFVLFVAVAAIPASAAPLRPAAGDRVAANAAVIASEIQDSITNDATDAAENLRRLVNTDDAFRIYHRDNQVLIAVSTRRNLSIIDKRVGERETAAIALGVLQQKFSHLFTSQRGLEPLDATAVRVVFMEPDAFDDCPGRRGSRGGACGTWQPPLAFAANGLWSSGWATPAPCTGCR